MGDAMKASALDRPASFRILGIPVNLVDLAGARDLVSSWATAAQTKVVFVREVASLMAATQDAYLADLHYRADLVVADGTPLVWIGWLRGHGSTIGRVPGADLVDAVCQKSLGTGQSHYFFGGKPGVAEEMAARLTVRHPGLKVVGTYSPPMREIGPNFELDAEARAEVQRIAEVKPDFIWVGISSPKQEYWMMKAAPLLERGVLFGVGAAFDFHSGALKRAPRWMRESGFEWLHRLLSEPRRLWRRYIVLAPSFVVRVIWELALKPGKSFVERSE